MKAPPPSLAEPPTRRRPTARPAKTDLPANRSAAGVREAGGSAAPPAGRCVLGGADWAVYRKLRDDPRNARFKFTYDGPTGRLEVEMPQGATHESVACLLAYFVLAFRQAGGPRFWPTEALTLDREDLDRGLDCDKSFYVTRVADAPPMGTNLIDLSSGQPPPDLAVEVNVTSPGVSKLPPCKIENYAALGVPEVWVWDAADGSLAARRPTDAGGYEIVTDSVEMPGFPLAAAADLIRDPAGRDAGELRAAFAERLAGGGSAPAAPTLVE